MLRLFVVVLAVFVHSAASKWVGCGGKCIDNNQCSDALCSRCEKGKCVSGGTCKASCTDDSDCERLRYCYLCTGFECSPGPRYPQKCGACRSNHDCSPSAYCNICIDQINPITKKAGKACGSGCGGLCATDYDCGIGSECSHCDQVLKTCQRGGRCGSLCGSDADCMQNSTCHLCIDATCSANCNQACFTNFDCNAPITGCGICTNGKCRPGAACGTHCNFDTDCSQAGTCNACVRNKCTKVNCGTKCKTSSDCHKGSCPACTNGICTKAMCNSTCSEPIDCVNAAANCTGCTNGKCTEVTCGSLCNFDAECGSAMHNCSVCVQGRCTLPQCGSTCSDDNQCRRAGKCFKCIDNQCSPHLKPGTCGIHTKCHDGNNNDCPETTCSHCDPFTDRCKIGYPCGSACIVQTDCNQLGGCILCKDVCSPQYGFLKALGLEHLHGKLNASMIRALQEKEDARRLRQLEEQVKFEQKLMQQKQGVDEAPVQQGDSMDKPVSTSEANLADQLREEKDGWIKALKTKRAKRRTADIN